MSCGFSFRPQRRMAEDMIFTLSWGKCGLGEWFVRSQREQQHDYYRSLLRKSPISSVGVESLVVVDTNLEMRDVSIGGEQPSGGSR